MKKNNVLKIILITIFMAAFLAAGATVWGGQGDMSGKPPEDPESPPPMDYPFYFWKLGHMDGPHDSSKALGISRDGKVAVGSTLVVDFTRAWRLDIDWAISTEEDGQPPLYNELQVQEDLGVVAPSQPSAAYAASDMTCESYTYDKVNLVLDWCGSMPVGGYTVGMVSYGIEWLLPVLDSVDEGDYLAIPDFGGGISDMKVKDVSRDGIILVGTGNTMTGLQAFRADTTVVDDGVPIPVKLVIQDAVTLQTLSSSAAEAVSEDGLIIAGYGSTQIANRAFVTTVLDATTDPITLESTILPMLGGGQFAEAYAMTPDGAIIAGRSDSPKGPQACIWFVDGTTGEWVVKGLGSLSKKSMDSAATGIAYRPGSAVGELIVVGRSKSILYPSEAFVWTGNPTLEEEEIGYFYDLEYILTKTGAGEASLMGSRWILNEATGISADLVCDEDDYCGHRIVGWGINPEGGVEAWLVDGFPYDELVFTHE
jgi:hypothetical protein